MQLSRVILILGLGAAACSGDIEGRTGTTEKTASSPSTPAGPSGTGPLNGPAPGAPPLTDPSGLPPAPPLPPSTGCEARAPGAEPLRRLSTREYERTVRDLFGAVMGLPRPPAVGEQGSAFDTDTVSQFPSPLLATQIDEAGAGLAAAAVKNLPALLGCDPQAADGDACARRFIASFGKRAFRRPLEAAEVERFSAFYLAQKPKRGAAGALELLLRAWLSSPSFLYHVEIGAQPAYGGAAVRLSPHEVANRLSYFLWGTMPDAALFTAAETGALGTREGVVAQARRLLGDPRSAEAMQGFYAAWLNLDVIETADKDLAVNKGFALDMRPLLRKEIDLLIEDVVGKGDGKLGTLLTAGHTFANERLATAYQLGGGTGTVKGAEWRRVPIDATRRPGILTRAGMMAALSNRDQSSPVLRGGFVREHMFCQVPPPPPNDIEVVAPSIKAGSTTKERFAQHTESPTCRACHMLMDPLGFGFENFDAVGRWRDVDQGRAVDATGEVFGTEDADGPYSGPAALVGKLAQSEHVARCAVTFWFRYAHRRFPGGGDTCAVASLQAAFKASDRNLAQLPLLLVQTDTFVHRTPTQ